MWTAARGGHDERTGKMVDGVVMVVVFAERAF